MPEFPVNSPLTASEALDALLHRIERYLDKGVCEQCALILVCADHHLQYGRVRRLWEEARG